MKFTNFTISGLIILSILATTFVHSQDETKIIVVTTGHWNMHLEDFSMDEWKSVEKEYFDKVTMKNDLIESSNVLMHLFTADNSEIKFVNVYSLWDNIDKAADRTGELIEEAWPNEDERKAFFKKQGKYYSNMHSDEIYSSVKGVKFIEEKPTESMVYYVRVSHLAFPEDGKTEDIKDMMDEYTTNVIHKNEFIKGYFPSRHYWGADSRDFVEAFVVESLGDIEKALDKNGELSKAYWPDDDKRKEFFTKMGKYFTGWHGDYIYSHVPELSK